MNQHVLAGVSDRQPALQQVPSTSRSARCLAIVRSLVTDAQTLASISPRELLLCPVLFLLPPHTLPQVRAAMYRLIGCRFERGVSVTGRLEVIGPGDRAFRNIHVGRGGHLSHDVLLVCDAEINVGDHAVISPWVRLITGYHGIGESWRRMDPTPRSKPITIGNGCWIGLGTTVLPGVTIGEGTVVGAGSVVTHDLPANVVAAGSPARVVRTLDGS